MKSDFLHDRIRAAKSSVRSDLTTADNIYANVRRQPVMAFAPASVIFPGRVEDGEKFTFRLVDGSDAIDSLSKTLSRMPGSREQWPFDVWLERADDHKWTVIEVRHNEDSQPAGFAIISTDVNAQGGNSAETVRHVSIGFELRNVYVSPSMRGKGFSHALSWVAAEYMNHIMLETINIQDTVQGLDVKNGLSVRVMGEAHSVGGASFLMDMAERIEAHVSAFKSENRKQANVSLQNEMDLRGFGVIQHKAA